MTTAKDVSYALEPSIATKTEYLTRLQESEPVRIQKSQKNKLVGMADTNLLGDRIMTGKAESENDSTQAYYLQNRILAAFIDLLYNTDIQVLQNHPHHRDPQLFCKKLDHYK